MATPEELEAFAKRVYDNVQRLTGWRDEKVRFWMEQANPLLGMVTPIWMIQHGKGDRLAKFIAEAEQSNAMYRAQYGSRDGKKSG